MADYKEKEYIYKEKTKVKEMFNDIAPSYDLLNRTLSVRTDEHWRKQLIKLIAKNEPNNLLDLATGTADVAIRAAKKTKLKEITGIDLSAKMLTKGQEKVNKKKLNHIIKLQEGDAENLNFKDNTFDCVTCAFGVRNFEDLQKGLAEIHRVLKSNGMLAILEFTLPSNILIKALYLFYFKHLLPFIGRLVSRHQSAYSYLTKTVEQFPHNEKFTEKLTAQGFVNCKFIKKTFGIVAIYIGYKK